MLQLQGKIGVDLIGLCRKGNVMKRGVRKFTALTLCIITIFSLFSTGLTAFAAEYSTAYPNTHVNTGNQREDILEVAYTQIGYVESGSDITKYNAWMTDASGYNFQGVAWCATFICWCANQAKVPTSIIARNAGCTAMMRSFSSYQIHTKNDGYKPRRGDICFLAYSDTSDPEAMAHVALVYSVGESTIKTVEGNCSNKVMSVERPHFGYSYGQYVVAYATPNYTNTQTVAVKGISLSSTSLTMKADSTAKITATVSPSDATNKTVTFSSSDTSVAKVDSNGNITALKSGTAKITAKASNGVSASCTVTVTEVKKLSSISVVSSPTKSSYFYGEKFYQDGLKVVATYSDSTTADVTSQCNVYGASTLNVGQRTVTVKYTEGSVTKSTTFTINVRAKLRTLTISSLPDKTVYYVGEKFNTTGLQVIAGYNDGTTKTVTSSCTYSGFSSSQAGTRTIKASYSEDDVVVSAKFTVQVNEKNVVLKSIEIKTMPSVTEYFMYDKFSSEGMKIYARYSDNSTKDVTDLCTLYGIGTGIVGTREATVRYAEENIVVKAYFNFVVYAKLKSLAITSQPTKTNYNISESFSKSGLKITATYSDATTKDVTSLCTFKGFDSSSEGTKTVVATYTERGVTATAKFSVNVIKTNNSAHVEKIGVTTKPTKVQYTVGERFDSTGLKITAYYSDSTKKTVTSACTLSGFDSSKATSKNVITVTYKEGSNTFTTSFYVEIKKPEEKTLTGISVTHLPNKTRYIAGEAFDRAGLVVTATYSDASTQDVTACIRTSGFDCTSCGTKTMTASYTYLGVTKTATFGIVITPKMSSIAITSKPSKLTYYVGEQLILKGMKITATLADGSTVDVTDKCTVTGFDSSVPGKYFLTITCAYGTVVKTKTFSVIIKEIEKTIEKIEAKSYSTYLRRGASAYNSSLKVIAYYNDGTTQDITSEVSVDFDSSKIGFRRAAVSYSDNRGTVYTDSFIVVVGL